MMTDLEIIGIIAFFSLVSVIIDAKMNKHIIRGEKAKYKKTAAALMVISWGLITWFAIGLKWIAIPVFLIPFIIRYALFDIILNKLMGWKWNFTGTTSQIDKLKIPFWVRFALALVLALVLALTAKSQIIEITVQPYQINDTIVQGKQVKYINTLYWFDEDTNPAFQSKLTDIKTTYPINVFFWQSTGEIYIYKNAYNSMVAPYINEGIDIYLKAICKISDINYFCETNLTIKFVGL